MIKGKFIDNLPKIYGLYTGGFLIFIILMAIAEQAGMTAKTIGIMFVAFTVLIYALIGWLSRTVQVDAYYVAGRQVPTVFNGMATAADWMSGASFVAMAGGIYFGGYTYMAFLVGWTGGYILVSSLLAPYLRKFGCYTVPDFIGTRYGGNVARFCAVVVLTLASFTYVTAQINATGTIASRALGIPFELGVWGWAYKYFIMFNVRWYESSYLDSGCSIHRIDYSLFASNFLDGVTKMVLASFRI